MFTKILRALWPNPQKQRAAELYIALVRQARNPFFYTDLGVADSVDGRFDMIVLHVALAVQRLEAFEQTSIAQLRNALMEYLIEDMDRNLREMGVSDTSVSRKMKKLASQLNGRFVKYSAAKTHEEWHVALTRNVYRSEESDAPEGVAALTTYVQETREKFAALTEAQWLAAEVQFGALLPASEAA